MGKTTGISWATSTWNPWMGCDKVSAGCKNCYAERDMKRYGRIFNGKVVRTSDKTFNAPLKWNLPARSRIFVCSWSDFYHVDADDWRHEAWEMIRSLPQYDFLIPTKRPERIGIEGDGFMIPDNVWLGASVENQEMFDVRMQYLLDAPAKVHWLSVEPMLGPIDFHFPNYPNPNKDMWVVFGGESGPGCRPCDPEWIRDGVKQCRAVNVPVFVKQLGGWPDTRKNLEDLPFDLQIREFPV